MVAWHEMPGKRTPFAPSRREGMIVIDVADAR
jgi:hypothetical protein